MTYSIVTHSIVAPSLTCLHIYSYLECSNDFLLFLDLMTLWFKIPNIKILLLFYNIKIIDFTSSNHFFSVTQTIISVIPLWFNLFCVLFLLQSWLLDACFWRSLGLFARSLVTSQRIFDVRAYGRLNSFTALCTLFYTARFLSLPLLTSQRQTHDFRHTPFPLAVKCSCTPSSTILRFKV